MRISRTGGQKGERKRVYEGFVKVDVVPVATGVAMEVVVATDSVAFLVYNKTKDEILLVEQERAPMIREDNPAGKITEVAAGRFDCNVGVVGLIKKELKEELGVDSRDDQIAIVSGPLALSPGVLTERQYLGYVEITDDQIDPTKRTYGVDEGENITRRFVPVSQLKKLLSEILDMKTWALLQWFRVRQLEAL